MNYHWLASTNVAALSILLSVGAELELDDHDRLISSIRYGTQDTINMADQRIINHQLKILPTIITE